jgi:hypothetical protein
MRRGDNSMGIGKGGNSMDLAGNEKGDSSRDIGNLIAH